MRKPTIFAYVKTKVQTSFAVTAKVTAKLISAFVCATQLVQFLLYVNPKFQASSLLPCLYRPVCVGPGRNSKLLIFLREGSFQSNLASRYRECI